MGTKSIHIDNPKDIFLTTYNLMCKLMLESVGYGSDNAQMIVQFKPEKDGKQWKMFVYYEFVDIDDEPVFVYSYQDEQMEDTDPSHIRHFGDMWRRIQKEIESYGVEFIALDYGYGTESQNA